ncbi:primary-amine oxidase [Arboricoccus pini]|uniref:Amine oxidase n=1 Tax=Arboricoccus pini TaxID=1963835 RepID=A0A212RWT9_9PROT|nr:primary-amine oxidase [Arboricoccus pini]SNB77175.1 primary-amine oxidase [Arboricoccus pini]
MLDEDVVVATARGCCAGDIPEVAAPRHPLEPLTPAEIARAAEIVRGHLELDGPFHFETIELLEPPKAEVRAFRQGHAFARQARVNVFRAGKIGVYRLTVSLDLGEVTGLSHLPTARPMIKLEEFVKIEDVVKADPAFIAACAQRGVTDMSLVCVDPWSAGSFGLPGEEGRHLCHTFAWVRMREDDNLYAHPLEGICAVLDIKTWEILRVDDHGVVPVPTTEYNYETRFQTKTVETLKPIDIVQPEGVSFALDGRVITWHKWQVLIGFNAREGLTLHDLRYDGRPTFYRLSLAEMVVPYGSPNGGHFRKNVFDIGEYGLGSLANPLTLGCDCLGAIQYLDAWLNDMSGNPYKIDNAICIHEEDAGILWKHTDFRTERAEVRRNRRLVISSISTVGNYEYGSYWYLYLDGTIEFEMKATGMINTAASQPGQKDKYAQEVVPGVQGQIHQHAFCVRMDLAIDGECNSVVELETFAEPEGPTNPWGNAFYQQGRVLERESEAQRTINQATMRSWKFINPNKLNQVGEPTGYKLHAGDALTPFFQPRSYSGKRAAFMQKQLWVTAFDPEERYPTGDYVNHSTGEEGLPSYVAKDRPLAGQDIVAWHVFGLHHQPRPEDFPVQPVITTGFKLVPSGFFDQNPCMDLPAQTNGASRHAACCTR